MSRRAILLIALLLAAVSCRKASDLWKTHGRSTKTTTIGQPTDMRNKKVNTLIQPVPEPFLDRSFIGSELGPDGTVSVQKQSFVQGEPVYVTMRFNLSPPHLQASLRVLDEHGKELHRDFKDMNGGKVVTFRVPPKIASKPGSYRLIGYWGGNDACDYKVDIRGRG